jgi:hypothetical protein
MHPLSAVILLGRVTLWSLTSIITRQLVPDGAYGLRKTESRPTVSKESQIFMKDELNVRLHSEVGLRSRRQPRKIHEDRRSKTGRSTSAVV